MTSEHRGSRSLATFAAFAGLAGLIVLRYRRRHLHSSKSVAATEPADLAIFFTFTDARPSPLTHTHKCIMHVAHPTRDVMRLISNRSFIPTRETQDLQSASSICMSTVTRGPKNGGSSVQ